MFSPVVHHIQIMPKACPHPWPKHVQIHDQSMSKSMTKVCPNPCPKCVQIHDQSMSKSMTKACPNLCRHRPSIHITILSKFMLSPVFHHIHVTGCPSKRFHPNIYESNFASIFNSPMFPPWVESPRVENGSKISRCAPDLLLRRRFSWKSRIG